MFKKLLIVTVPLIFAFSTFAEMTSCKFNFGTDWILSIITEAQVLLRLLITLQYGLMTPNSIYTGTGTW